MSKHLCPMLRDFLENVGEWYENDAGIHISVPTYNKSVGYTLQYCPFCWSERVGSDD